MVWKKRKLYGSGPWVAAAFFKLNNMSKKTLVLGASPNPERYSYLAVKKLKAYKHPVVAVGRRASSIDGTAVLTGRPELEQIDTVTLYLNPANQVP